MAFPTIPTVAASRILTTSDTGASSTHTFPNLTSLTKDAGDLLIAVIVSYQGSATNATFGTWGGGFTEFEDSSSTTAISIGCAYKWSTGSETGTFTVVGAAQDSAMFLMSIPGAHATTPPEAGGYTTVVGCDPDPFAPAGWVTAEDTLWIGVAGCGETSTTGSFLGISAAPTNYTDYLDSGITADVVGGIEGAVAFRQLNAASEDPAAFSNDTSNTRGGALVIAVRPVTVSETNAPAGNAAVAGTAEQATLAVGANAGDVAVAAAANDATVTTSGASANAPAGTAAVAVAANDATVSTETNAPAGNAAVAATAGSPTAALTVNAEAVTATVAGFDATVSTVPAANAPAGNPAVAAVANDAATAITVNAETATTPAAAQTPTAALGVNAGHATSAATANNATISTAAETNAFAQLASVTSTAADPTAATAVLAEVAAVVSAAYDALIPGAGQVFPGVAEVAALAYDVSTGGPSGPRMAQSTSSGRRVMVTSSGRRVMVTRGGRR